MFFTLNLFVNFLVMIRLLYVLMILFTLQSCSKSEDNSLQISTLSDIDGNQYNAVKIGSQIWMQQNLNVSHYRNGDPIPNVQDPVQWYNLTTGAWCYYENQTSNGTVYGKLYNWHAINDPRGFTPEGWHIPTKNEVDILRSFLDNGENAGYKMKSTTNDWLSPSTGSDNSSGFTGLPAGYRSNDGGFYSSKGSVAIFWGENPDSQTSQDKYNYTLLSNFTNLYNSSSIKEMGYSVRCVKNY